MAKLYGLSEHFLNGMDNNYSRLVRKALIHRPTVVGLGTAAVVAAFLILPTIGFELMPQADEGEVSVTAELPVGTRVERAQDLLRATNLTVTEVCHAVGFSSLGSFSSRFRELVGESPSQFQRRWAATGAPYIPGCFVLMWGLAETGTGCATEEKPPPRCGS